MYVHRLVSKARETCIPRINKTALIEDLIQLVEMGDLSDKICEDAERYSTEDEADSEVLSEGEIVELDSSSAYTPSQDESIASQDDITSFDESDEDCEDENSVFEGFEEEEVGSSGDEGMLKRSRNFEDLQRSPTQYESSEEIKDLSPDAEEKRRREWDEECRAWYER